MVSLTLDWLHLITFLGAVHGLVLAGALATKRRNRTANRLLAVLMVSFSIFLASSVYHAAGLEQRYPHFFGLGYPQPFVFGPLVYLYAVAAADRSRTMRWKDVVHFLPVIAALIAAAPVYLSSGVEKLAFFESMKRADVSLVLRLLEPVKFIAGIGYAIGTIVFLLRHRERVKASYSSTERVNLQWLLWLGGAAGVIWAMAVVFQIMDVAGAGLGRMSDDIIALAVAILVYAIGYRGMRQPEIFRYETAEYAVPAAAAVPHAPTAPMEAPDAAGDQASAVGRYEKSGLTPAQAGQLRDALLALMDRDKPWQDSELTLADLAERLSTTPHKLSEVLNAEVGQTFYDFVNAYRVREVQRRIAAGEAKTRKILALALDAGFASKSTFNTVFKKHTSLTPSDYRQAAGA